MTFGGGDRANWRICSKVSGGTAWSRRPAFGWSSSPSTPASTNRRRIRETDSGDKSSCTAMSIPLAPAALKRMTRARRTMPAGADGRAINALNCFCCVRVTLTRREVCVTRRIDHILDPMSTAMH